VLLLETLQSLEVALHRPEVRSNRDELDRLLHPEFREFGRSGHIYERAEVLAEFADRPQAYEVWAQDFRVVPLSDVLALLTYKSAHVTPEGKLDHHTASSPRAHPCAARSCRGWQAFGGGEGQKTQPMLRQPACAWKRAAARNFVDAADCGKEGDMKLVRTLAGFLLLTFCAGCVSTARLYNLVTGAIIHATFENYGTGQG
jgi:hypothetical protein